MCSLEGSLAVRRLNTVCVPPASIAVTSAVLFETEIYVTLRPTVKSVGQSISLSGCYKCVSDVTVGLHIVKSPCLDNE